MDANNTDYMRTSMLGNRNARTAARENRLRRHLAEVIGTEMQRRGLTVRGLAEEMGTSVSQVQRLLHRTLGGSLTLRTVVRAADTLGLNLTVEMTDEARFTGIIESRHSEWQALPQTNIHTKLVLLRTTPSEVQGRERTGGWSNSGDVPVVNPAVGGLRS